MIWGTGNSILRSVTGGKWGRGGDVGGRPPLPTIKGGIPGICEEGYQWVHFHQ